ncbi:MAG: hydrogenase maturation nickel metallochaperone HypA [Candidatus Izemoplasmatales bacterium]|nr:hydrogenase maturation nickel metallochaperone HypA [Candidatus Izemoplasmatales bacterium]
MHELGIMIHIVDQIEEIAKTQHLQHIDTLVLEVGELSGIVPHYLENVYPMAVENSILQHSKLQIHVIPGKVLCRDCHHVFHLVTPQQACPKCQGNNHKLISGQEFNIKEIVAY